MDRSAFCERVALDECTKVNPEEYTYDCRCGGQFIIPLSELEIGFCIFHCTNCSLTLCVKNK